MGQYYPLYETPRVELTDSEMAKVIKFGSENPAILKKLRGANDAKAAIIREHNKAAIRQRLKKLEADGAGEEELKRMRRFYEEKYLGGAKDE